MSIIDNAGHTVVTHDGKNKAFAGQRLAKFSWKTNNVPGHELYGIKRDSKCVSLPMIAGADIAANLAALTPAITSFLHGVQDKMVREMLEVGNNVLHVTTESISIAAICEWLEGNDESGRLTKESVASWFDSEVSDNLAIALAAKLGVSEVPTDAESQKIMDVVAAFKGKISSLAGGKTSYEPKISRSLISALELAPSGDALASRFIGRLEKMIAASVADDALLMDAL